MYYMDMELLPNELMIKIFDNLDEFINLQYVDRIQIHDDVILNSNITFTNLSYLDLSSFNQLINFPFPNSLRELYLNNFNQEYNFPFPNNLKRLELYDFNKEYNFAFPNSLTYLNLYHFDKKYDFLFPQHLIKNIIFHFQIIYK